MNKELLKRIILENQEFIPGVDITARDYSVDPEGNYIIVGPRRAGKTYFLYRLIKDGSDGNGNINQALYINFEDERLMEMRTEDLDLIIESYREMYDLKPVLYFDEIQIIPGWQKFLLKLTDLNYRIYVAGSNAELTSSEMVSVLGGRFIVINIDNLSFEEFLHFKGIELEENFENNQQRFSIVHHFYEYMTTGGFPEALHFKNKKEYLSNLFQKVFYGDITSRYMIRNEHGLKLMVKKIAENIGDESAFNHIKNLIQSAGIEIGTSTVIEYFSCLEKSFLAYQLSNYYSKFAERENKRKFYFADNGFLNLFLLDPLDKLLENLVFNELRRKKLDEFFYIRDRYKIDFYLPDQQMAIQVAYSVERPEILKPQIRSLKAKFKTLDIEKAFILTFNEEFDIEDNWFLIKVVPAWKWLLKGQGYYIS